MFRTACQAISFLLFICHYHFHKSVGKELFGEEYNTIRMDILLSGKRYLAQRFADINSETIRQQMKELDGNKYSISAKLKRMVSAPTFPESLTPLMDKKVSHATEF